MDNYWWFITRNPQPNDFIQIAEMGVGDGNRLPCIVSNGILRRHESTGRLSVSGKIPEGEDYE